MRQKRIIIEKNITFKSEKEKTFLDIGCGEGYAIKYFYLPTGKTEPEDIRHISVSAPCRHSGRTTPASGWHTSDIFPAAP